MSGATVHLVDASPYIFRAFHALPSSLRDPEGRPANAVRGFTAFLLRLLAEERPSHLGLAFDHSLTTSFRNELFPDYKAQREPPPPELEAQAERCQQAAAALGAKAFSAPRYEADDLIGTLCEELIEAGCRVRVVSSDKDLCQLVGRCVELFDFARGERLDEPGVKERFGVAPSQIPDLLALAGDPVDNIPGVAGVGGKTAVALLQRYSGVEQIYRRLDEVAHLPIRGAAAVRRRLEAGRDRALLCRRLATVERRAPVQAEVEELRWRGADPELVEQLFPRLGCDGLRERVPAWAPAADA